MSLLTRLPTGPRRRDLAGAAGWLPAVGLLVGGTMAGTRWLAGLALPAGPATVLAMAAAALLTGAMHEDALADCADALGARGERARRLEILHDPRVGAYGALALALSSLLAFSVLAGLSVERFARAALTGHLLARWSVLPPALWVGPARARGAGAALRVGGPACAAATVYTAALAALIAGWGPALLALGAAGTLALAGGATARRLLGGVTGDTLGAVCKLAELIAYLALAAAWSA